LIKRDDETATFGHLLNGSRRKEAQPPSVAVS
jgi:hypothetical protein